MGHPERQIKKLWIIKNANVFDGVDGQLIKNAAIVMEGEQILDILPECRGPCLKTARCWTPRGNM